MVQLLGKEGEIDFAVMAMLPKVRVLFELEFAWVFEDEDAVVGEDIAAEDSIGYLRKVFEGVRGVGENDVELLVGSFQEVEDIGPYGMEVGDAHVRGGLLDEINALVVDVDRSDLLGTTRDELDGNGPGAGKKVHDGDFLEIDIVVQDVEEAFASHVGGGTHGERRWRIETAASE